jgi:ATP-dependent Clp protease ATP-binding subunit ClpC
MNLSVAVNLAWQVACAETAGARKQLIDPEHFLAALTKLKQLCRDDLSAAARAEGADPATLRAEMELVADVLADLGVDPNAFRHELRARVGVGTYQHQKDETVHRSDRSRRIFQRAAALAQEAQSAAVNTGCLFLAILEEKDSVGCKLLVEKGVGLDVLASKIRASLAGGPGGAVPLKPQAERRRDEATGTPFLDQFGRDLTKDAREGRLGPIIGRRKEILQVIQTLARRSKNNPVLLGEAGVGKTAIAEAIAIRAAKGKDPQVLAGKRFVELSMSTLVAGTKYRGAFEERLAGIVEECRAHPEIIVFIDELHTVIGAGKGEGSLDAAQILKPALARGDVRCIGATTVAEYRRYIESDPALERRFEKVIVTEPSREEALEILCGLCPKFQLHHGVAITLRALEAAVELSRRFDVDHQLPDKAIDLVDKAGARVQVPALSWKAEVGREVRAEAKEPETEKLAGTVTELTVAQVLAEKIGVPLEVVAGHLEQTGRSRLLEMQAALKKRVIGQDEAIDSVCQRLMMAHAGLGARRGPLAVFLFLGPTGVGKTELARCLAAFLFGPEEEMIRLDMSEYMEEHSVAKLFGSPPGYIGHEEEGQLTGKLRSRPYSVVLLDEIEKAHSRVFDLFLQVLDEGRLTDSKGRTADARNAIFIMTSNIPADKKALGFRFEDSAESKRAVFDGVKERFRPEFINRINEQVVFRPLSEADVKAILRPMLEGIAQSLAEKYRKVLRVTEAAVELIAAQGYSEEYGVRHLRRTVETLLEAPLSRMILSGEVAGWQGVVADAEHGQVVLRPLSEMDN